MSIRDLNDWGAVELKAQTHELSQVDSPKVPDEARERLQAKVREVFYQKLWESNQRKNKAISEALMYLSLGESTRAQEVLNRGLLDL